VVKIVGHEDSIFYLGIPVDNPKRLVCLKDPYFVVCPTYDADDKLPDMPMEILEQIAKFVAEHDGTYDAEEADDTEDDDTEDGA
jgi:hypothetical protein